MEQKKKWCMVTCYIHKNLIEGEDLLRTGLYSWIPAFEGDIRQYQEMEPEDFEKYDIIQVNMSGQDMFLPNAIREVIGWDSKTKIVANNDYTVELWPGSFDIPEDWKHHFDGADMIFGTEPYQVGALETLLKRKVHVITHPCFVKRLNTLRPTQKTDFISVVAHRYDNNVVSPSIAIRGIKDTHTRLIGYDPGADKKPYVTSACYKHLINGTNYMDFCEQLMQSKVVVDPFSVTSQSRVGWDCAAMGVPLVGSNRNYSTRICYPKTICDPFDVKEIRRLTKKLLTDETFRNEVIEYAKEAVKIVNYDNSKARYLEKLEEGSQKITED